LISKLKYYRILIPDGRWAVSTKTLLSDINKMYAKCGYHINTTGKSAKVLGVTLAFELGLSNDEIRILGRWRSLSTAQHYRNVEPQKLLKLGTAISFETRSQGITTSCFFPATLQSDRQETSASSELWSADTQTTASTRSTAAPEQVQQAAATKPEPIKVYRQVGVDKWEVFHINHPH
jgi:hypothetical protein